MPPERAIKIVVQICKALDHIHSHGVIHRDLKPENIMVDEHDNIKIIDFGISANSGARRITFAKLTDTMGTPDYISPEQVKGGRGDARSDVYAVGVMLYEMLTGSVPFTGANPFVIMNDRLLNDPVPPRELNPELSPQLQEVLYRALERNPQQPLRQRTRLCPRPGTPGPGGRGGPSRADQLEEAPLSVGAENLDVRCAGADPSRHLRAAVLRCAARLSDGTVQCA